MSNFQGSTLVPAGQHQYNQYNKPTRCKCGGRPYGVSISFPHFIDFRCKSCESLLGAWHVNKYVSARAAFYEHV